MAGELLDVGHHDGAALFPCCAADAATVGDMHACYGALERAQQQLVVHDAVEACPPEAELVV